MFYYVAYHYRVIIMHLKIWDTCGSCTILNPDLVFVVMKRGMLFGIWTSASAQQYKIEGNSFFVMVFELLLSKRNFALNKEVVCFIFYCIGNSNDPSSHRSNFTCIKHGSSVLFCWWHVPVSMQPWLPIWILIDAFMIQIINKFKIMFLLVIWSPLGYGWSFKR